MKQRTLTKVAATLPLPDIEIPPTAPLVAKLGLDAMKHGWAILEESLTEQASDYPDFQPANFIVYELEFLARGMDTAARYEEEDKFLIDDDELTFVTYGDDAVYHTVMYMIQLGAMLVNKDAGETLPAVYREIAQIFRALAIRLIHESDSAA